MKPDLNGKLKRLRDLTAHRNPCPTYAELVELMADYMLDGIDPVRKAEKIQKKMEKKTDGAEQLSTVKVNSTANPKPNRHCSAQTECTVWVRAQSRCEHVDEKTGLRCDETRRLQLDHVIPYAISQDSSEKNTELVCTQHNLYRATQWFGSEFMKKKIGSSPGI